MSDSSPPPSANPAESPGRRERKRQQTTDHLADTAWSLFETQGFDAVTMEGIAAAADVSKVTLYKHFPVKEALLAHCFHRELAIGMAMVVAEFATLDTITERLRAFFRHSADWSQSRRAYLGHYIRFRLASSGKEEASLPGKRSGLDHVFTALIAEAQDSGEFRRELDASQLMRYLQFLHLAALLRWLEAEGRDLQQEFDQMLDLFLRGVEA